MAFFGGGEAVLDFKQLFLLLSFGHEATADIHGTNKSSNEMVYWLNKTKFKATVMSDNRNEEAQGISK